VSIEKKRKVRGKWVYDVRYRDGDGRQRSAVRYSKKDAEAFEDEMRRQRRLGAFGEAEPSKEPVVDYLRAWFASESARWQASTVKRWGPMVDKWIAPYLSGMRLCDLGPAQANEWFSAITSDGASARQANYALTVLSSALGHAVRLRKLPSNPCAAVRKRDEQVKKRIPMTAEQVERIRAAMSRPRDRLVVSLMSYAGLRPEEVFALEWQHVLPGRLLIEQTFCAGVLSPRTKTSQARLVSLIGPLEDELVEYREAVGGGEGFVVPNRWGDPLDLDNWRFKVWRPATEAAGVEATPYTCRHTFASLLANEGRLLLDVGAQLGHNGSRMTELYAHLFDPELIEHGTPMTDAVLSGRDKVSSECAKNVRNSKKAPKRSTRRKAGYAGVS